MVLSRLFIFGIIFGHIIRPCCVWGRESKPLNNSTVIVDPGAQNKEIDAYLKKALKNNNISASKSTKKSTNKSTKKSNRVIRPTKKDPKPSTVPTTPLPSPNESRSLPDDDITKGICLFVELGGSDNPDAINGQIGLAYVENPFLTVNGGLAFMVVESSDDFYGGLTLGLRGQLPTFITPFVGVGLFAGYSEEEVLATDDQIDNDEDGDIDEADEKKREIKDILASVYPEVGVQIQITKGVRLILSGKYQYTTQGRAHDFWLYSLGLRFGPLD